VYCDGSNCFYYGDCSDHSGDFSDIEIQFTDSDETYTITPDQYLFNGTDFGYNGACIFGIMSGSQYSLGNVFLQKYYTIYDQLNN
jgi:hypothetical protein